MAEQDNQTTYFFYKVKRFLYEILLQIVGVFCLIGGLPYLLFLIIMMLILRPIVKIVSLIFRPDLAELLPPPDSIFTQLDDPDHVKNCIVVQVELSGAVSPKEFIKTFEDRVLYDTEPNGNLRYHEFQQFPTSFMGFMFWKWEENFDLKDHIRIYTEDQPDFPEHQKGLEEIGKRLLCGPFQPFKSPWDFTLVTSTVGEPSTTIFFRIHHGIADGYSILYMFQRLFGSGLEGGSPSPPFSPTGPVIGLKYCLTLPTTVVKIVGELVVNSLMPFLWKIPQDKKSRIYNYRVGSTLRVEDIKRIKNKFGVTFSAVVFALLGGGMHRFIKKKYSAGKEMNPMKMMPSMIPVPMKGHGDTFENHFSFTLTNILVGETDPIKRLRAMNSEFIRLRHSPLPFIGSWIVRFHGSQINWVGRLINKFKYAPLITTYFPAGAEQRSGGWALGGCHVQDYAFFIRMVPGDAGGTFCISSYKDSLRVTPVFNDSVLSQSEVNQLSNEIDNEIEELLKFVDDFKV